MSYYVGVPLLVLVALIEASVLPMFRIGGLQPNLTLVLLIVWLTVRGASEAFVLIPIGGIVLGLVDGAPMGTALLALAPVAVLDDMRGARLREGVLIMTIVFTVIMTITYHLVYLFVFMLYGQSGDWVAALLRVAIPTCFLNVLVMLPTYLFLWSSSHNMRRASYV